MKHKIAQHVALHGLVHEAYAASGMTDPQFAAHASKELGFEVNSNHVQQARRTYNILEGVKLGGLRVHTGGKSDGS